MGFLVFLVVVFAGLWIALSFLRPRNNVLGEAMHEAVEALRRGLAESRNQDGAGEQAGRDAGFVPIPIEGTEARAPQPRAIELPREPAPDHIPLAPGESRVSLVGRRTDTLPLATEDGNE